MNLLLRFWHGVLWFGKGKRIFPVNIKRYRAGDSGNSSNPFSSQKRYVNKTRQKCVGSSSFVRFEDFFCKREKRNGGFPRWYNPPPRKPTTRTQRIDALSICFPFPRGALFRFPGMVTVINSLTVNHPVDLSSEMSSGNKDRPNWATWTKPLWHYNWLIILPIYL